MDTEVVQREMALKTVLKMVTTKMVTHMTLHHPIKNLMDSQIVTPHKVEGLTTYVQI